jgi:hypothetical protein
MPLAKFLHTPLPDADLSMQNAILDTERRLEEQKEFEKQKRNSLLSIASAPSSDGESEENVPLPGFKGKKMIEIYKTSLIDVNKQFLTPERRKSYTSELELTDYGGGTENDEVEKEFKFIRRKISECVQPAKTKDFK